MSTKRADGKGKKPEGGFINKIQSKTRKKEVIREKQSRGWDDSVAHNLQLPEYKAEEDPYCPRARNRKFNEDQKKLAKISSERGQGASDWLDKALVSKFEDVPIKMTPSLREKATQNIRSKSSAASSTSKRSGMRSSSGTTSGGGSRVGTSNETRMAEVEILQKAIIRENLVAELHKLIQNQNDLGSVLGEVIELVKAIRFQTVDIMEDVEAWQHMQRVPKPFLYRGQNYVVKIFYDMAFLDKYQMLVDTFGFQFAQNPLMYNKTDLSGSRVSLADKPFGFNENVGDRAEWNFSAAQGSKLDAVVDGVEVLRLEHVEKLILKEFDRLEMEKSKVVVALPDGKFVDASGETLEAAQAAAERSMVAADVNSLAAGSSAKLEVGEQAMGSVDSTSGSFLLPESWKTNQSPERMSKMMPATRGTFGLENKDSTTVVSGKTWKSKFSNLRVKRERIMQLMEEVEQLKAILSHIEEQTGAKVMQYHDLTAQVQRAEKRRVQALREARETAAQHLAVEIAMMTADKQSCNQTIKELQREAYFIGLERKRKRGIVKKLEQEVAAHKKQTLIKKKLGAKINKDGILEALKGLNAIERVVGEQSQGKKPSEADTAVMEQWSAEKLLEDEEAEDFFPMDTTLPPSPSTMARHADSGFAFSTQNKQQPDDEGRHEEGNDEVYDQAPLTVESGVQVDDDNDDDDEEEGFLGDSGGEGLSSSFQEVTHISEANPTDENSPGDSSPFLEPDLAAVGAGLAGVRALQLGNVGS